MELDARVVGRLLKAGLATAGQVIERLIAEGDEGLLCLGGIGPKTLEQVKTSITESGLLEDETAPAEAEAVEEGVVEEPAEAAEVAQTTLAIEEEVVAAVVAQEAPEAEGAEVQAVDEVVDKAKLLELAMQGPPAEAELAPADEELEPEVPELFFEDGEPIDREEKLRRERGRRVQLVFDEDTGELIPRRRRKREPGTEEWGEFAEF
jgi:hypothetical protein